MEAEERGAKRPRSGAGQRSSSPQLRLCSAPRPLDLCCLLLIQLLPVLAPFPALFSLLLLSPLAMLTSLLALTMTAAASAPYGDILTPTPSHIVKTHANLVHACMSDATIAAAWFVMAGSSHCTVHRKEDEAAARPKDRQALAELT